MEKRILTEKIAKKAFDSARGQQTWEAHMQMFGPILEPAFAENYVARVHLGAALNRIGKKDAAGAQGRLKAAKRHCLCDADHAAWLFFMGVCRELAGDRGGAIHYYRRSCGYHHRFFLPYIKVAKQAYDDRLYEIAVEHYRQGIALLEETGWQGQEGTLLSSAWNNLAGCLLMMHRFGEAAEALRTAAELAPGRPGFAATEALLYAAMGDKKAAAACLSKVEQESPGLLRYIRQSTNQILRKRNPHFSVREIPEEKIQGFWEQFSLDQTEFQEALAGQDAHRISVRIWWLLRQVFPFLKEPSDVPKPQIRQAGRQWRISLADGYTISLEAGYARLLEACPDALKENWQFEIVHTGAWWVDVAVPPERPAGTLQGDARVEMRSPWEIDDPEDFLMALNERICEKCQYGEEMEALSGPERMFHIAFTLIGEVENGGFIQYFSNCGGPEPNEAAQAFAEIGAAKTAAICKRALSVFDGPVPDDQDRRAEMLAASEDKCLLLYDCDGDFFTGEEDLTALMYAYIQEHKEAFSEKLEPR